MSQLAKLPITGDSDADDLLTTSPLALLLGMMLDQQVTMESAFRAPAVLNARLGGLDAKAIVAAGPEALTAAFVEKPALHRFPGSMATRAYALCEHLVEHYGGEADALWTSVDDGAALYARIRALPGFGDEKSKIFLALLAKRFDVRPAGWETAAGAFGDDVPRSAADVDGPESLVKVREWKRAQKKAGKTKQE
jgi:uncharacterized HhH-GPD family protein